MAKTKHPNKEEEKSVFNGSLDTLTRINNLIIDISLYRVNEHWFGMKENLGELLVEAQGCLSESKNNNEFKELWGEWNEIEEMVIVFNDDGTLTFDEKLPKALKDFNAKLRLKLYRHDLTMAKASGFVDRLSRLSNHYGI
jgi:hypothetical protein